MRPGPSGEFVEYRRKEVLTVLSRVAVQRAYYYCSSVGGVIPKDQELDIVGTCFSPGRPSPDGHWEAKTPSPRDARIWKNWRGLWSNEVGGTSFGSSGGRSSVALSGA